MRKVYESVWVAVCAPESRGVFSEPHPKASGSATDSPMAFSAKRSELAVSRPAQPRRQYHTINELTQENNLVGEAATVQCFLVRRRDWCKDVIVPTKGRVGKEGVSFLTVHLVDNTGLCELTAWREDAIRTQSLVLKIFGPLQHSEEEGMHMVQLRRFKILCCSGNNMSPMRRLSASTNIVIEGIEPSTLPYIYIYIYERQLCAIL